MDHLAPSDVEAPLCTAQLLSRREEERQGPGLSPPPAEPRCQDPAAAGIRRQRPGPGREGHGGLAVLLPARCTKPALVRRPRMRALGPDLPGSAPSRARGPASRPLGEGDVPPAADAGLEGALCQGSWGPARGSTLPWAAGPRPGLRGPQPVGFSSCGSWAPATYGGSEGALVTVTRVVGVDGVLGTWALSCFAAVFHSEHSSARLLLRGGSANTPLPTCPLLQYLLVAHLPPTTTGSGPLFQRLANS